MVAYLGWGSLIWQPKDFREHFDYWRSDGPYLPIEFCRVSKDGRLTLAILEGAAAVQVLWSIASSKDVSVARSALAEREGCPADRIGAACFCDGNSPFDLAAWMDRVRVSAVLWTNLPPKFAGQNQKAPSQADAVSYLQHLKGDEALRAQEYVRRAPPQIRTIYRNQFEKALGWVAHGDD